MCKRVFGNMQTVAAQISQRILTVGSGPSLSANRIIGHYRMCQLRAYARMGREINLNLCSLRMLGHIFLGDAHLHTVAPGTKRNVK